jgi:hypothetical protein
MRKLVVRENILNYNLCVYQLKEAEGWREEGKTSNYYLGVYQLKEAGGEDKDNPPFTGGRDQGGS